MSDWHQQTRDEEQRKAWWRAAVKYVADALYDGWADAVADRVAKYVTQQTWQQITAGQPAAAAIG